MTLSNKLTAMRLLAGPLLFGLYYIDDVWVKILCLLIVIASEVSDALDGTIARRRNETTDFGKLFDPFADSISRFTFFAAFMAVGLIPPWMLLVLFLRDSLVSFIRLMAATQNVIVSARRTGKIKAVTQATGIIIIICADILHYMVDNVPLVPVSGVVMTIVVAITLYSAVDYTVGNLPVIRRLSM
ncbi:CDP-alcohol phosphatidyltransferase family protein [bacterium]|nr:CDP-alcohol phosphatidyltransferase family protein [candidate division CSSED10-310 bacterium]